MPKADKELLLFIASKAGIGGTAKTSTAKIARLFGISQQTASRKLRDLEKKGLIRLNASPSGCAVSLTREGIELLRESFALLQKVFAKKKRALLKGIVKIGLGEGKYYVSRLGYLKQFKEKLGFKPFFGTLNLKIDVADLNSFLLGMQPVEISGFKTDERSFGKINAFMVRVEKQKAALIFPERTAHKKNEVEVIAPINLRKKFRLNEGSRVLIFPIH